MPVTFYNRAYNDDQRNLQQDKQNIAQETKSDTRLSIRRLNYVVLVFGCAIGLYGFVDAIREVALG